MARASAQDIAAMDKAQAEVERLLKVAEARADLVDLLPSALLSDAQEASISRVRSGRLRFNQWADSADGFRRYALDGRTPTGAPYSAQDWMDVGYELGELMAAEAKEVLTKGLFQLYTPLGAVLSPVTDAFAGAGVKVEAGARTVTDAVAAFVKDPPKPGNTLKVVAVVAGGTVVLGTLGYFLSQVNALRSLFGGKDGK